MPWTAWLYKDEKYVNGFDTTIKKNIKGIKSPKFIIITPKQDELPPKSQEIFNQSIGLVAYQNKGMCLNVLWIFL